MSKIQCFVSTAVLAFFLVSAPLFAQTITGTITGVVMDQSRATIPGAEVTATNVATGVAFATVSDNLGSYRIALLPPGTYDLSVELPGFKTGLVTGIEVRVDVVVARDVILEVGEVTENVTVAAETNLVETESPNIGSVVSERQLVELPLAQRSFLGLASTTAGVMPQQQQNGEAPYSRGRKDYQVSISGQRAVSTNTMFDGIPTKEFFVGVSILAPPVDAIAEFKVQFGYFAGSTDNGSVVNVITKSGTNEIHGSAWNFHQNDNLNARNFFSAGKPETLANKFGAAVGGPAMQNKLFWYGSFEYHREKEGFTARGTVPPAGWTSGDLSSLLPDVQLVDPLNNNAPFPNNQIPSSRIDPFAKTYLGFGFIPQPNQPGEALNLVKGLNQTRRDETYLARADYFLSESNRFFGRYLRTDSDINRENVFSPFADVFFPLDGTNIVADWVSVLSPQMTLNVKFGYSRSFGTNSGQRPAFEGSELWADQFGLRNLSESKQCDHAPGTSITGLGGYGARTNCGEPENQDKHFNVNTHWVRGKHSLSWGGELRRKLNIIGSFAISQEGFFQYNNAFSGNNFADFLLGHPSLVEGSTVGPEPLHKTGYWFNGYIQDEIKVAPSLSLSLGLRYQVYPWMIEDENRTALFDRRGDGGFIFQTPDRPRLVDIDKNDWAPRIGFAWSPGGRDDLVVRSSFAIFYDEVPGNELAYDGRGPNTQIVQTFVSDKLTPTVSIAGQFPDPPQGDPGAVRGIAMILLSDPFRRDAYHQMWTLNTQKSLPGGMLFDVGYIGSHGVKMSRRKEINIPDTGNPFTCDAACVQSRRPFPDFSWIMTDDGDGQAWYHGLQTNLRKTTSSGVAFQIGYTYSKALDTDSYDAKGSRTHAPLDYPKGRSTYDVRQRFVTSLMYETPALRDMGAARHILGGWLTSGILALQTGLPYNARAPHNSNAGKLFHSRPDRICDGNLPEGQRTVQRQFDTSCFVLPGEGQYGNSGAHPLDTDGMVNLDFALIKNIPLQEQVKFQFRFEAFNAFNKTNFGRPGHTFGRPTFGVLNSALSGRIVQFGLKVIF